MIYRILILLTSLFLVIGCSETHQDKRLARIAEIVSDKPKEALSCLDSINYKKLSDSDKHYYDFLNIKAKDKAYIKHTSDSSILRVIDYYSQDNRLYPEALYYGGRVYFDMGESPKALLYFHKALDNIPEDKSYLDLKANILSQTARLLTELRLYDEAVPYIKSSINIGEYYKDTVNIVHDIQLLGGTYLRDKKYNLAEHYFNKAIDLSSSLPISFEAKSRMYLAAIKYEKGQLDSALTLIRNTPDLVNSNVRNNALGYAAKIYLHKNILDTAYTYAQSLIHSPDSLNKGTGYHIILSPKLKNLIPLDTLYQHLYDYSKLLETYHDNHKAQLAITQQSFYNYQRHEIKNKKSEEQKLTLIWWICGISSVCLILATAVLYYKNKAKKALIELHIALENASRLNENLNNQEPIVIDNNSHDINVPLNSGRVL